LGRNASFQREHPPGSPWPGDLKHRKEIIGNEVKVMKRINNRSVAVEAVLTRCGTIVGPFMSELTGHAKLTPYRGGWCGNETFPPPPAPEPKAMIMKGCWCYHAINPSQHQKLT
jgi:hypothetical protein